MYVFSRRRSDSDMVLFMLLFRNLLLLFTIAVIESFIPGANLARNLPLADNDNPPSQLPPPPPSSKTATFKPSVAVIVGILTTMFSVTFLLLLYAKHCIRGTGQPSSSGRTVPPSAARKNSGVDRIVIESLPIFRFGSLRGEKDGLECAVCLNRFEPTEVLRLLPKCKHAFHVECVDTWLDAHSTCPLCRYRVDPEDILLVGEDAKLLGQDHSLPPPPSPAPPQGCDESLRRVSGRHSSAGERGTRDGFLQAVLQRPGDSSSEFHHREGGVDADINNNLQMARRSLDSWNTGKKMKTIAEMASAGCFDRQPRKDELLLTMEDRMRSDRRRLDHRIIISSDADGGTGSRFHRRWSDVQPSDLLYLRSEMIMSDSRRFSGLSRPSVSRGREHQNHYMLPLHRSTANNNVEKQSGRSVISGRSVSEITGLSRFWSNNHQHEEPRRHTNHRQRLRRADGQAGLVSRGLAWISQSQHTQPTVRP